MAGYSKKYFYVSELFAEKMLGAKIVSVYCVERFTSAIVFDNGWELRWYEDSEGPHGIALVPPKKVKKA
ncbi:MAG: hypothetical protein AAB516_01640 [Patescibacteria group bacterium]